MTKRATRVSPTIAMLGKIAQSLEVPVAALFSPIDHRHIVSRAAERSVMVLHGPGSKVERLVRPDGGHLLEGNLHTLAPGSGSPLENDYVETAIVADLPVPVDRHRPDCVTR